MYFKLNVRQSKIKSEFFLNFAIMLHQVWVKVKAIKSAALHVRPTCL